MYRQIAEELRNVGEPQSDNMVISKILETLPPSYSCIDTVWSNTPAANQTMPNFIAKVTEEERKIKERSNGVESPQDAAFFASHPSRAKTPNLALAAHGQGTSSSGSSEYQNSNYRGKESNIRPNYRGGRGKGARGGGKGGSSDHGRRGSGEGCWTCGQHGHKEYNCPEKKKDEQKESRNKEQNSRRDFNKDKDGDFVALSSLCHLARRADHIYADSGATSHLFDNKQAFSSLQPIPPGTWKVRGVGNTVLEAAAIGDVPIISYVNGKAREGVLKDVLYVPGLGVNLYSIGKASALGIEINFLFEGVDFKHNGDRIMSGQRVGDSLYYLNITLKNSTDALMGISSAPEHPCVISLELATNQLEKRFKQLGIVHQKSCRHTPQQNSVVERDQRTTMEATRSTIYMRTNKWTN